MDVSTTASDHFLSSKLVGVDLNPGTSEWDSVKSQVWKAISEYGCFKASFDKIPLHLEKSFLDKLKELFDLPLQTKTQYVSEIPFNCYLGQSPPARLCESFGIEDPSIFKNCNNFTNVLWPQGNPNFSKNIHFFSKQVSELEKIIRRMILESLSLGNYLDEHMKSTTCSLRVMKYEVPESTETTHSLKPHTDKNLITILFQNQVDGLEVQTRDGEWISVELSQDHSFVILIGDSFKKNTVSPIEVTRSTVSHLSSTKHLQLTIRIKDIFKVFIKSPNQAKQKHAKFSRVLVKHQMFDLSRAGVFKYSDEGKK
ncbi:unnamed protein product [Dovyalis caffra]|uniref:Fe2OG dioxygenase domain-containing protein n=1 Tax=Dovyalis caffra TaxID=77055 RepID=A0AAV1SSB1_9ROSI|nr:unnamed protein product [Dovyalis caffra]